MPIDAQQISDWKIQVGQDEIGDCLDDMMEQSVQLVRDRANEVISLNARFHNLRRGERMGVLNAEERRLERNRIRAALIELLDEMAAAPESPSFSGMVAKPAALEKVPFFISWSGSAEDEPHKQHLEKHLILLRRMGKIDLWDPSKVQAGQAPEEIVPDKLGEAALFAVLLSQDYFFSDACFEQLEQIQQQRSARRATVIPILVRACQYEALPIGKLQILPRSKRPVAEHANGDAVWAEIARELTGLVNAMTG